MDVLLTNSQRDRRAAWAKTTSQPSVWHGHRRTSSAAGALARRQPFEDFEAAAWVSVVISIERSRKIIEHGGQAYRIMVCRVNRMIVATSESRMAA
jgi:hypothetical protein